MTFVCMILVLYLGHGGFFIRGGSFIIHQQIIFFLGQVLRSEIEEPYINNKGVPLSWQASRYTLTRIGKKKNCLNFRRFWVKESPVIFRNHFRLNMLPL